MHAARRRIHFSITRHGPGATGASRGSILIVALLVSALIALVLGSYLSLNLGSARLSQRTFNRGAAFHLAEAGLEEGLWAYNRALSGGADAWDGWLASGDAAWRRFDGFALGATATGTVKVYAHPVAPVGGANPALVALASVQSPGNAPVTQMLEVTLRRRSLFAAGIVARESLAFRGRNVTFDSWDSDPDQDAATPAVAYSAAVAVDRGGIATGANDAARLFLNRARIYGYLRTRGLAPVLNPPGLVGPFGTADGVIDFSRVGQDYNDSFPAISAPAGGVFLDTLGPTLGTAGMATLWQTPSLRLSADQTLTILGDVTLVLTDPIDALSLAGNAALIVPPGSSLTIYAAGDLSLGGRGIANSAAPGAVQFWSTSAGGRAQRVLVAGRSAFSGLIYAPEADMLASGNAEFFGAVIARNITFAGNVAIHHDLALGRVTRHAPYRAGAWRAIETPADRAALAPLVDR